MLQTRNFLMPDATFVIEMIAFVVVLFVMTKFVLPRVRHVVAQRQAHIAATIAAANEAQRQTEQAQHDAQALLAVARREAREITDRARWMRDQLIAEGRREGHAEYLWRAQRAAREAERANRAKQASRAERPAETGVATGPGRREAAPVAVGELLQPAHGRAPLVAWPSSQRRH